MQKLFEEYRMSITPLTPIHVGSGEEIMPGDYFIFDEKGRHILYAVDMGYLGSKLLQGRETLCKWITDDKKPFEWMKKVRDNRSLATMIRKYARFRSSVTSTVAAEINQRWGTGVSRLGINVLQRPVADPIIPGSSIKGAIRTALLYSAVPKPLDRAPTDDRHVSGWERVQLGSLSDRINDDLLRHLKIADAAAKGVVTEILDAEHVGMRDKGGAQAELIDYRECLPGVLEDGEHYALETSLVIASGHPHHRRSRGRVRRESILEACRNFYGAVMEADEQYWRGDREVLDVYREIRAALEKTPGAAPIRLGWGCGMDSISLNLAKPPGRQTPGRKDFRFRYNPRTRRVLDGLYPPGWAMFALEAV